MKRLLLPIISFALAAAVGRASEHATVPNDSHAPVTKVEVQVQPPVPAVSVKRKTVAWQPADRSAFGTFFLAVDRSLVEREEELIEADTASPEASPVAAPFSLSRPENIVSNDATAPVIEDVSFSQDFGDEGMSPLPETPTWALFGLGAAFLVFTIPARNGRSSANRQSKF